MMSQSKEDVEKLEGNSTGDISVYDGTIVGRVRDNSENATPLFTVTKSNTGDDVWYGRAFLVYKDSENNTFLTYSKLVLATIKQGAASGNEDIYSPNFS